MHALHELRRLAKYNCALSVQDAHALLRVGVGGGRAQATPCPYESKREGHDFITPPCFHDNKSLQRHPCEVTHNILSPSVPQPLESVEIATSDAAQWRVCAGFLPR